MTLPIAEPDRSSLRAVRTGVIPLDDVLRRLDDAAVRQRTLTDAGDLPDDGNRDEVDRFLVRACQRSCNDRGAARFRARWRLPDCPSSSSRQSGAAVRAVAGALLQNA